jgi:hypothetical protein
MPNTNTIPAPPDGSAIVDAPVAAASAATQVPGNAQIPAPPDGSSIVDTMPAAAVATAPNGMPANSIQAVADEQTPEGHAAAVAAREAQHPVVAGLGEAAGDVWSAVKSMANPLNSGLAGAATQAFDHVKEAIPIFQTYENARANGKTVIESLGAANAKAKQIHDAQDVLAQRVDEFKKNPTAAATRAIADAAALAATMWTGGEPLEAPAPSVEAQAAGASTLESRVAALENSRATGGATHVWHPDTGVIPIEEAVARNAVKSGLPVGTPETTTVPPTGEDIQPSFQKGIHDVMTDVAKENGVETPNPNSVRDVAKNTADQVFAKSKNAYAQLDEASGGRWQRFDDQLKNVRDKMKEVAGIDDDKYAELEQKQNEIETSQAQLIEDMKAAGKVDPALADEARANYKKAQALYDVDSQVKMSTTGRAGVGKGVETVDPNKLAPRLHKLYDSGRLQQAVGDDRAAALIDHAETAQTAAQEIKDFEPSTTSATGQQAMQELLRPNTGTGVSGRATGIPQLRQLLGFKPSTNWLGVYRDMNALAPEELSARFGADAPAARTFIASQARKQLARIIIGGYTVKKIADATGIPAVVLHTIAGAE